jgi:hypothetical protein
MARREGVCYALPLRDATEAVRAVLVEKEFPLAPPEADASGLIATRWKDTTIGASRLTFAGRPSRLRLEVLLAGGPCLRFAVRSISQHTPKEGPEYSEVFTGDWSKEQDIEIAIDERLRPHARPWQPPADPMPAPDGSTRD